MFRVKSEVYNVNKINSTLNSEHSTLRTKRVSCEAWNRLFKKQHA